MQLSPIQAIRLYPLAIPLRQKFSHALAERQVADPLVVAVELRSGMIGFGETLPRSYVTGETVASVIEDVQLRLARGLEQWRPETFADALELVDSLPQCDASGRLMLAARAGLETALLDAYSRHFRRRVTEAAGWLGLPGFGVPGSAEHVRCSGVLSGGDVRRLKRSVLKMRLYGLRDFKLKVGFDGDVERVGVVVAALGASLGKSRTLRLDANGGWALDQAVERLTAWAALPIACIEQPVLRGKEHDVHLLRRASPVPIMHDESVLTSDDLERLYADGVIDAVNIRLSKNGGFLPALRLAGLARQRHIFYQLGCMVGETSILSAAGRRFLECTPGVTFAEGCYGRFLLAGDIARRPVRFGFGGRLKPLDGYGWGIDVDVEKLGVYSAGPPVELRL